MGARAGTVAMLGALVAALLPVAAQTARADTPATWNLPFPQTMSYRVMSEDPRVDCGEPDATFQQEIATRGLDSYEIDVASGHRGECGRLKAEQFKRLYPDKMVILYENPGGDDPRTWPGGTWAGYYLLMNRTNALAAVSATQTTIPVANPAAFTVGDTALMWLPTDDDAYANSEWVTVDAIVDSALVVTRDIFSTGALTFKYRPRIAAAATGPSYPDPDFNMSSVAPVNPANGERANQWMARNIIDDFAPTTADAPTLDGIELDTSSWTPPAQNANGAIENVDCNGDGKIDYCNRATGTHRQVDTYGTGYDAFIQNVKRAINVYDTDPTRPAKMVLADGELGLRSLASADGAELESFPSWDNYADSSAALDTFGVWQNQDTAAGPHLNYAFTKDITPVYPQPSAHNPTGCILPADGGTCRNGEYRYGLAAALVTGGASAYNNEASFLYPQRWDEEATINQATTGLAPGYLGQPLGPAIRKPRYTSASLIANPSFETDLTGVSSSTLVPATIAVSQDPTTAAPGFGTASLRADVNRLTPDPAITDSRAYSAVTGPISAGEYTVDFWARGVNNAAGPQAVNIGVGLDGVVGAPHVVLVTNTWTHYFMQLDATKAVAKNALLRFSFGDQIGSYWIDGVNLYRGTAGAVTREFTNGIAVLNDSFTTQDNVFLPGGPYHHIDGVQDTTVNDGTYVGSFLPTIAAKDGEVLLRGIGTVSPPPTVSVGDVSLLEGDSGVRTMTFPVTLAEPARSTVSVDYSVTGVTATGATKPGTDVDFRAASGTLTFQPAARTGQTPLARSVSVRLFGDTTVEPDETLAVTLSNPTGGAGLGRSDATGTILNDDPGTGLRVGVGDASIVEGNAGTRSVVASVTLSAAPGTTIVSVPYTIAGGTAIWGKTPSSLADFGGALSGTLTFRGAAITRTITIPIYANTTPQIDRTIIVNLGSVTGATAIRSGGVVTILDDD
jgi:hypothetical protein